MAAPQSENDKLRQQIAFLTNLINSARGQAAPPPRQPVGYFSNRPNRFSSQPYSQLNQFSPRPQVAATQNNVRFPVANPSASFTNQRSTSARNGNFSGHQPFRNAVGSRQVLSSNNFGQNGRYQQPIGGQNSNLRPPVNSSPVGQRTQAGCQGPTLNSVAGLLGAALRQQNPVQMYQGHHIQQRSLNTGANFVQMSLPNADVCIPASQASFLDPQTSRAGISSQSSILNNQQSQFQPPGQNVNHGQTPMRQGQQQRPSTSVSLGDQDDPRTRQMAALMNELSKTQNQILELQQQLLHQKTSQSQQNDGRAQNPMEQHNVHQSNPGSSSQPNIVRPGLSSAAVLQAMQMVNAARAKGPALTQSDRVWRHAPGTRGVTMTGHVVGRPVRIRAGWNPNAPVFPKTPAALAGPRLIKPVGSVSPFVVNNRFQLRKAQSMALANSIQASVRAQQARRLQQSLHAPKSSTQVSHFESNRGMNSVQTVKISEVASGSGESKVQSMEMNRIQSGVSSGTTFESMKTTQIVTNKFKVQRSEMVRSQVAAAQAIVSKYKLYKTTYDGSRASQMHFPGRRNVYGPRLSFHSKITPRFANRFQFTPRFAPRFYMPAHSFRGAWQGRYGRQFPQWNLQPHWQKAASWRHQTDHSSYKHAPGRRYQQSRVWRRNEWFSGQQKSETAMKDLLKKRLQILKRSRKPSGSRLKLDRRPTSAVSSSKKSSSQGTTRLVLINGLLYKSSSKRLAKASISPLVQKKTSVSQHPKPSTSGLKKSVVVKKLSSAAMKTVTVRGVKFRMDASGKTLQRLDTTMSPSKSSSNNRHKSEVRRVDIGGVTYIQTKPGVLVRSASLRTRALASRMKSRSIAAATHSLRKDNTKSINGFCVSYNRFGRCKMGTRCPYKHDPSKVAVCTRFLRGTCKAKNCVFSHKVSREKMPVCSFFLQGTCSRDDCPYLHVKVNKDAAVCQDFVRGFCPRGEQCPKKHTLRCQTFAQTGVCEKGKKCPLLHKRNPQKSNKRVFKPTAQNAASTSADCTTAVKQSKLRTTELKDLPGMKRDCESIPVSETPCDSSDPSSGVGQVAEVSRTSSLEPSGHPEKRDAYDLNNLAVSDNAKTVLLDDQTTKPEDVPGDPDESGVDGPSTEDCDTVDKLPSFISLADVSGHQEVSLEHVQESQHDTSLHIKPRL